jgi:PKD repeat protein
LDLAARWTTPATTTPTYKAIKMYRNYDGNKSTFGDVSVAASGANPDNVAVFGAERTSDGALTVMVINKYLSGNTPVNVALSNFSPAGTAQVYQLTSANVINHLSDIAFSGTTVGLTVPPQSITLLVLPKSGVANQPPVAAASANPSSGYAPLNVTFSSAGSSDSDGSIVSYSWAFGDGGTGSGAAPSHVYQNVGSYTAVLTVTDNQGATNTASVAISTTTDPNVVNAPSNLSGSGGKGTVSLSWRDNSGNETGFNIERAPSGSSAFAQVGQVGANVTTFQQSLARGKYVYRVRAFNGGVVSGYSNSVTVQVK